MKDIPHRNTGLVLSGGGARAAYQVGVLKAISELLPFTTHINPFPTICGTSAGAINATVVAAYAQHFKLGMRRLENVWASFHCQQVFHTDLLKLSRNSLRWLSILHEYTLSKLACKVYQLPPNCRFRC